MAVAQTKPADQSVEERRPAADWAEHVSPVAEFTKEEEFQALRQMLLIRRFEEKAGQMYGMGLIGGFCHLYIGQEAVVVGMKMAMQDGDQMITGYRDHGHMLACGMDPKGVMAELTGRRGGYSKGKGGSMHMFSRQKNFFGGHGIVGAQVPIGTGLAFANMYRGNNSVCLTFFGDGAANQGQVYESFNMAELWKLPVVYVIENNRYAMGTAVTRSSAQTDLSKRGVSFNIPGTQVDGMDVRAVKAAADAAIAWCRAGNGPTDSRNDDLPLSRPLHVGSGKISDQGRGRQSAHRARSDRAGAQAASRQEMGERRRAEEDRRCGARGRQRGVRVRHPRRRARSGRTFFGCVSVSAIELCLPAAPPA